MSADKILADEDLGLEAKSTGAWRWLDGMLYGSRRHDGSIYESRLDYTPTRDYNRGLSMMLARANVWPRVSDPGTLGCIQYGLLVDAFGDCIGLNLNEETGHWRASADKVNGCAVTRATRQHALIGLLGHAKRLPPPTARIAVSEDRLAEYLAHTGWTIRDEVWWAPRGIRGIRESQVRNHPADALAEIEAVEKGDPS